MADFKLRIGTRESKLATWQAEKISFLLEQQGIPTRLVFIKTEGDKVLDTPLPLMGGKGVFTKALDDALYADEIDLAVHSFKDVPTLLPKGLIVSAICEREDPRDVFVFRKGISSDFLKNADTDTEIKIATSSNRRMAQWRNRFPNTDVSDIRGNVQTRMRKLDESDWHGVIFAAAGLKRLQLEHKIGAYLDWMLPAPAQGALCIMSRENDTRVRDILANIHDENVALCTQIERDFLNELEGGCSAPIGAFAEIKNGKVHLETNMLHLDGSGLIKVSISKPVSEARNLGREAADLARKQGADEIVKALRGE